MKLICFFCNCVIGDVGICPHCGGSTRLAERMCRDSTGRPIVASDYGDEPSGTEYLSLNTCSPYIGSCANTIAYYTDRARRLAHKANEPIDWIWKDE